MAGMSTAKFICIFSMLLTCPILSQDW